MFPWDSIWNQVTPLCSWMWGLGEPPDLYQILSLSDHPSSLCIDKVVIRNESWLLWNAEKFKCPWFPPMAAQLLQMSPSILLQHDSLNYCFSVTSIHIYDILILLGPWERLLVDGLVASLRPPHIDPEEASARFSATSAWDSKRC